MKIFKKGFLPVLPALLLFVHCNAGVSVTGARCSLELPALPPAWAELLGAPHWRIEWISPEGKALTRIWADAGAPEIDLPQTLANPVSAWPFFPDRGIPAGLLRPAGAVFPFDAAGEKSRTAVLRLGWQGGIDAALYRELAAAVRDGSSAQAARIPQNFDWKRFRELFSDPEIPDAVRADPWIVDWKAAAEKIVKSGFNKRSITAGEKADTPVPVSRGPWFGSSPFASPLSFEEGTAPAFPADKNTAVWFSGEGLLKVNTSAWLLTKWGE
ncbi:MAG: hypothetical protein LBN21_05710 [Treponema sp.]|jgi:hypothetical protein|nr:hypothetical protein [Treponema sp.]